MTSFVTYYRVSTDGQGLSKLGLEAQRTDVERVLGSGHLLAEFQEVESGKRSDNRPQLLAAIDLCKRKKAVLIIAKLDRLARNVAFIANLMESKVEFIAADMPTANKLTIHIMAAFAEHEAEAISTRTKAALQALKARGVQLGNKNWQAPLELARAANNPVKPAPAVIEMMRTHREAGLTLRAIAGKLNDLGLRTPKGNVWYPCTVNKAMQTMHS